jgi:UPF0716 protein FxsA
MPWLIGLALLVVPIVEIYVIIQVGQAIGGWPTVALLIVESALGAWLVKREGRRAWNALQSALQTGKLPGRELTDGGLVLIGGTLLLTPGFVTDIFGFLFIVPFTRPLVRRSVTRFIGRRAGSLTPPAFTAFVPGATQPPRSQPDVVQGEVVDPEK